MHNLCSLFIKFGDSLKRKKKGGGSVGPDLVNPMDLTYGSKFSVSER